MSLVAPCRVLPWRCLLLRCSKYSGSGPPTEEHLMRIYAHRRLLTGLAVLTSLALLAGASGGGDKGGEATPPPQGEASGQLRVVSNWTGSEGEAFQAVIDGFKQKNPKGTGKGAAVA